MKTFKKAVLTGSMASVMMMAEGKETTAGTNKYTQLSGFLFPLQTSKAVSKKEGVMPDSYKISEDETALNIKMDIAGDKFPLHIWLTNELGKLAYAYWVSTNAELETVSEEDGVTYTKFKDEDAFFSYLTGKATGNKISKDMRTKAANDADAVMAELGFPADGRKTIKQLITDSTMTVVYDIKQNDASLVDNIIDLLSNTSGNVAVLQNWKDGRDYVPPVSKGTDFNALADMFNKS